VDDHGRGVTASFGAVVTGTQIQTALRALPHFEPPPVELLADGNDGPA
jgi:hypothetical protein